MGGARDEEVESEKEDRVSIDREEQWTERVSEFKWKTASVKYRYKEKREELQMKKKKITNRSIMKLYITI